MTTDFNDPRLVFEHSLREHINAARATLDAFDEEMGEMNASWDITYDAEGNGKWTVRCWRYDVKAEAAQLFDACWIARNTARNQRASKTLPALLSAPTGGSDDTISSGSDAPSPTSSRDVDSPTVGS